MRNKFYSQETLNLCKEALNICNTLYDPIVCCVDHCEYANNAYCKIVCLQEQYNVVNLQILQPLDFDHYMKTKNFCIAENKICRQHKEMKCDICLIETLVRDKNIRFVKKGET